LPTGGVQGGFRGKFYSTYPGSFDGVLQDNRQVGIAAISDGTSNTWMIGEGGGGPDLYARGKLVATAPSFTGSPSRFGGAEGHAWADGLNGEVWTGNGNDYATGMDSSSRGLGNPNNCLLNCNNSGANHGGWYSFHTASVNFVFADGSVKSIKDTTDGKVLLELITIAGSVVIPGDY